MEEFSEDRQVFYGRLPAVAAMALECEVSRELTPEDILVRQALGAGSITPKIKSLRATHHKLAQCLAHGFSDEEASVSTGYSPSRISILKNDPSFQELLSFYSEERKEIFVDVSQRMAGFATTAVEVLQERIEDTPEAFSNKDLNNLIKTTADRGGHGPVSRSEIKTINLTAADLAQLKQEVENKQNGQVRRINQEEESQRVKEILSTKQGAPEGTEPENGHNDNRPPSLVQKEAEAPGSEGKGDNI